MKMIRTGRSVRICAWMLAIALLFAGCGATEPAPTVKTDNREPDAVHQPTQLPTEPVPTEMTDNRNRPNEEDGFVRSYPLGTTVSYDLNGDGIDEDITVHAEELGEGLLTVGNTSLKFDPISPTGYYTIITVDKSQKILLVGISDYGFSDDDMTALYAYDGAQIATIGFFEDVLGENSYGRTGATCHGDGTISARDRMDVLGTWMGWASYRLGEAGLEDHTELYRLVDWEGNLSGWEVTTNVELTMYTDSVQTAGQVTVPAGTAVRMIGVKRGQAENTHWACFEVDSLGADLWLLTEEIKWQTFVCNGEEVLDSEEVFDGFFYAG